MERLPKLPLLSQRTSCALLSSCELFYTVPRKIRKRHIGHFASLLPEGTTALVGSAGFAGKKSGGAEVGGFLPSFSRYFAKQLTVRWFPKPLIPRTDPQPYILLQAIAGVVFFKRPTTVDQRRPNLYQAKFGERGPELINRPDPDLSRDWSHPKLSLRKLEETFGDRLLEVLGDLPLEPSMNFSGARDTKLSTRMVALLVGQQAGDRYRFH